MREEFGLLSSDGVNTLHVYKWKGENPPKAVVQLSHGMTEYLLRYEEFAEFLVDSGYAVVGNDHLGHGLTAKDDNDLGYFGSGKNHTVVKDLFEVTKYIRKEWGEDIPVFLFGHSMGSFLARQYIMTYPDEMCGAIICGTGYQPAFILEMGRFLTGLIGLIKGERHRSEMLTNIAFGAYNKRIANPETVSDWLTKDKEIVAKYRADKFCTFTFTVNGYSTLFNTIKFIQKESNIRKISQSLPVFLISGAEDPVGTYGEAVKKVYENLKSHGLKDVSMKLYEGDRHEILNETDRKSVMEDILTWLNKHMED